MTDHSLTTMRQILCTQFGSPERLTVVEAEIPQPSRFEVVVQVAAVGVSFADGLIVRGAYQVRPALPFVPGTCFAGFVVAAGSAVSDLAVGDEVAGVLDGVSGAYTSHLLARASTLARVPSGLDADLVAASIESYMTSTFALTRRTRVRAGDQVVVLGAGGGVGQAAVDVARSLGGDVIAVASSPEKREAALAAGAREAIGYEDLKATIRRCTRGGADVVVDPVGGRSAEDALRALRDGGRYCVVGFAAGSIPRLPMNHVLLLNRTIIGVDWGGWARDIAGPEVNAELLAEVLRQIANGALRPSTPKALPLEAASVALRSIEHREAVGKTVLLP